ncbi:MAG: hypothetical protein AAGU76_06625 [Sedimentibacter sp.]|uniref:hypothetical protein n=1 Tax=Sedimentibacter sp. TaxID=1960295 RepID=UPI003158CE32
MKKPGFKTLSITLVLLLSSFMYVAVENTQKGKDEEMHRVVTDAVRRSAVLCYAIEGFYPPDIEYLKENYGLLVDSDKYVVSYSVFASNVMPEIEVFNKQP